MSAPRPVSGGAVLAGGAVAVLLVLGLKATGVGTTAQRPPSPSATEETHVDCGDVSAVDTACVTWDSEPEEGWWLHGDGRITAVEIIRSVEIDGRSWHTVRIAPGATVIDSPVEDDSRWDCRTAGNGQCATPTR